jgi:glycosyltransferase involved in cell wall biosynthesis
MKRAHVVVVQGMREGWLPVVTEANSCGTPAIGYYIVGHKASIRHGETALLTERTPQAMARLRLELRRGHSIIYTVCDTLSEWMSNILLNSVAEVRSLKCRGGINVIPKMATLAAVALPAV